MKKLIIFLFFISTLAHAELGAKYGLGLYNSAKDSKAETKFVAFDYKKKVGSFLLWQTEAGGWFDKRDDLGRKSSGFFTQSIGPYTEAVGMYGEIPIGIAGITNTDTMLGGHFQFTQSVGFGFKGSNEMKLGVEYKHFSSAGIYPINFGRDFFLINFAFPLFGK